MLILSSKTKACGWIHKNTQIQSTMDAEQFNIVCFIGFIIFLTGNKVIYRYLIVIFYTLFFIYFLPV